jgi:hypothetical protein
MKMRLWLSLLLIPVSVLTACALIEGLAYLVPLPKKDTGLENAMDPWGMSLFSCIRDDRLGYRLKPGAPYGNLTINDLGYVGKPFSKKKREGVLRIVCVGGSTTFCTDIRGNEYAWPAQLETLMNAAGCAGGNRVEVINAGVPGYHSWHTLLRLDELLELEPDVLILMDGFNDVNGSAGLNDSALEAIEEKKLLTMLVGEKETPPARFLSLLAKSRAWVLANTYMARLRGRDPSLGLDDKIQRFNTENNLRAALARISEAGKTAVLLNHPWSVRALAPERSGEEERMIPGVILAPPGAVRTYVWGRRYVSDLNKRLARDHGVAMIDPQPALDAATRRKQDIYAVFARDAVHLTEYGNALFAHEVYRGLLGLESFQRLLGADPLCLERKASIAAPPVERRPADWGSGWMAKTRHDVAISPPIVFNASDHPGESGDWGFYSPSELSSPARLSFGVSSRPGAENLLFFMPRIVPGEAMVEVYIHMGEKRERIYMMEPAVEGREWTPIALRQMIDMSGFSGQNYIVEVVLTGKSAQLWHDGAGNALFFR